MLRAWPCLPAVLMLVACGGSNDIDAPPVTAKCDAYTGPALDSLKHYEGAMHEHSAYSDGDIHSIPRDYFRRIGEAGYSYVGSSEHSDTLDKGVFISLGSDCFSTPDGLLTCLTPSVDELAKWDSTARQAAADMSLGHRARTARENEVAQRADFLVPQVDGRLQALHFGFLQGLIVRHRQFAAEVEQAMLTGRQDVDDFRQPRPGGLLLGELGQQQADLAVQGIQLAHGFHARVVLAHPAPVGQSGFALVAGLCVDLAQSIAHQLLVPSLGAVSGRRRVKQVPWPWEDCTSS